MKKFTFLFVVALITTSAMAFQVQPLEKRVSSLSSIRSQVPVKLERSDLKVIKATSSSILESKSTQAFDDISASMEYCIIKEEGNPWESYGFNDKTIMSVMLVADMDSLLDQYLGMRIEAFYFATTVVLAETYTPMLMFDNEDLGLEIPGSNLDTMKLVPIEIPDSEYYITDTTSIMVAVAIDLAKGGDFALAGDINVPVAEKWGDLFIPNYETANQMYYGWGANHILGLFLSDASGSEKTLLSNVQAYVSNGQLNVVLANDAMIQVYDMVGKVVATKQGKMGLNSLPLSQNGTYIVRAGKQSIKVIL